MVIWLQFVACGTIIVIAGTMLSRYGDIIAEKTGLGRTWIGVVLMASVTSLPELITGISSVALYDLPDIAAADVIGSCAFNLLILACLDLLSGRQPISARAHRGHVLAAGFGTLLLSLTGLGLVIGDRLPALGWISLLSIAFVGVYLLAMRLIFTYEKLRIAEVASDRADELQHEQVSARRAYLLYGVNALVIIGAATYLPFLAGEIAIMTGLGQTVVGALFVALVTSLPEVVVSISAVRLGAVDLAFGNLLGSNLFNIGILALDDIAYLRGPLLASVSSELALTAMTAVAMTAVATIGLTYRAEQKRLLLAGDALSIIALYLFGTLALSLVR